MTAAETIAARAPGFRPKVALVLGTGLGTFTAEVKSVASISYDELEGFPRPTVQSHAGKLVLGTVGATPVAVLQGRAHYYEFGRADEMKVPIQTLAELGCETVVLTNAAGSLKLDMPTASAPRIPAARISAGVSKLGPQNQI